VVEEVEGVEEVEEVEGVEEVFFAVPWHEFEGVGG
jgi:hypothetical protein